MDVGEPLIKFASRASDIRDQLLAIGKKVDEEDVAKAVMAGLPSEYETMRTVFTASEATLDLSTLVAKLLIVEQRKVGSVCETSAAYHAKHRDLKNVVCWKCGRKGHIQSQCRKVLAAPPVAL
jgi:hypothetical protein